MKRGNRATRESTRSFEMRQGSPLVLSFNKPPGTIYSCEPYDLSARVKDATDNLDDVQFQYDGPAAGTDWQNIGSAIEATSNHFFTAEFEDWTPAETGSYKLKVIVTDTTNNEGDKETSSFTVVSGKPEVVSVPKPSGVYNGVSKNISATVKDPSGKSQGSAICL